MKSPVAESTGNRCTTSSSSAENGDHTVVLPVYDHESLTRCRCRTLQAAGWVKRPQIACSADVEAADVSLRVFLRARARAATIAAPKTITCGHDTPESELIRHRRGAADRVLIQIDDAVPAERRVGEPRSCVERHELKAPRDRMIRACLPSVLIHPA